MICLDCQRDPSKVCAYHFFGSDNLSDGSEFRASEVEMIARYQHNALQEVFDLLSPATRGSVLLWSQRLKELGVVPK